MSVLAHRDEMPQESDAALVPGEQDPDGDLSDDAGRKILERTCIVTRTKGSPDAMIRFVVGPEGAVVPDIRRRLPGRGVWVSASEAVVAQAVRKQAFARGFKAKVAVDAALPAQVAVLLTRDALQSLAMANKAGAVTTGFAKVEAALAAGRVLAVLHASEASEDGIRKLDAAHRRQERRQGERHQGERHHGASHHDERHQDERHPGGRAEPSHGDTAPLASINFFTSEELDLALGRTNVIHAALAVGKEGHAFLTRCRRAVDYRAGASRVVKADAKAASAEGGAPG